MSSTATPARRLEAAGFTLHPTDDGCIEIYAPSGRQVATLEGDRVTLHTTTALAREIATLLIRHYSSGGASSNVSEP